MPSSCRRTAALALSRAFSTALVVIAGSLPASEADAAANPFFALCVGDHDPRTKTPADQAKLLRELDYDGLAHVWVKGAEESLAAAQAAGITLYQIYVKVSLAAGQPAYDPRLKELVGALKGKKTMLALLIEGGKPSDESLDARAVAVVREIADVAATSGLKVALYPHTAMWLERTEDAVRVTKKTQRANVGAMFNLCHWLKVDRAESPRELLKLAAPHLIAVTINGADAGGAEARQTYGWDRLIRPLGDGSYDVAAAVKTLRQAGFTGPVGLQCYGIKGDMRAALERSIAAWRAMTRNP